MGSTPTTPSRRYPACGLVYRTPAGDFYVRSHGDLPEIDAATWRLSVDGEGLGPLDLSLADLRALFPEATVTATMQCAGNRRADMRAVAPVSGDPWDAGAIGTADWTGVRLGDVLRAAGVTPERISTWPSKATTWSRAGPTASPFPRQGARRRDAAGLCDERGTAAARARLPGPCRRAGLRGGAQPEMAAAHHGAGPSVGPTRCKPTTTSCSRRT